MATNWFMADYSWSIKCIIHLSINYLSLKGLVLCFICGNPSCIFKFLFLVSHNIECHLSRDYCSKTTAARFVTPPLLPKQKDVDL